jgi:hypothetical protein
MFKASLLQSEQVAGADTLPHDYRPILSIICYMTVELAAKFPEWCVDPVNLQRQMKAYDCWIHTVVV